MLRLALAALRRIAPPRVIRSQPQHTAKWRGERPYQVHDPHFLRPPGRFTPDAPWGALVIFVPVIGGLLVTWIVDNFAPEAKGHGVPEVMDAIYYKGGIIRPVVALVKSIASAFAIGSGAAVGWEGPIIQIGSALGSTLGQFFRMQHPDFSRQALRRFPHLTAARAVPRSACQPLP